MNPIRAIRSWQARSGYRVLGAFAAFWLNLVLQPCAMALTADQMPHCPHCPAAHRHTAAHDSGAMSRAMPMHSEASASMPMHSEHAQAVDHGCPGRLAGCANLDQINHQPRAVDAEYNGQLLHWIAACPEEPKLADRPVGRTLPPALDRLTASGSSPPLNVLYCVYLK